MLPRPTLDAFDVWFASRSLQLEAIVIGGSALAPLGVTEGPTRDVDILHPELSADVALAAREFAAHMRGQGVELAEAEPWRFGAGRQPPVPGAPWPEHVRATLTDLRRRLNHGL